MVWHKSVAAVWKWQQTAQKRNVFGWNQLKEVRGLQSETGAVAQFNCSASAACWQGSVDVGSRGAGIVSVPLLNTSFRLWPLIWKCRYICVVFELFRCCVYASKKYFAYFFLGWGGGLNNWGKSMRSKHRERIFEASFSSHNSFWFPTTHASISKCPTDHYCYYWKVKMLARMLFCLKLSSIRKKTSQGNDDGHKFYNALSQLGLLTEGWAEEKVQLAVVMLTLCHAA